MERTFDLLRGEASGEQVADAMQTLATEPSVDLAALIARFNDIDARINQLESKLTESLVSQVNAPAQAAQASAQNATLDDPGEPQPEPEPEPEPEPKPDDE